MAAAVLYQLATPAALAGILVALAIGLVVHDAAQTFAAQALGDRSARAAGRAAAGLGRRLEPFGAVAAVIAGYGWGSPVPMDSRWRARRWRLAGALAAGPLAYLLLALVGVALLRPVGGGQASLTTFLVSLALTWGAQFIVSLLPLPPLDGGRIMLALAPPTLGWQKARYQLEDRNLGVATALAVVLLPRLFQGLAGADVVRQLAPQVLRGLGRLVGLP